jgi:diaminopimelate decarboxylase
MPATERARSSDAAEAAALNPSAFLREISGELAVEQMPLSTIAERFGTPCYVYSRAALTGAFMAFDRPFGNTPHLICYAVKANSNLALLNLLSRLGSGFDIVSGGELTRVLAAGGRADRIVFSGVGKSAPEIEQALQAGILCFNVESRPELLRINALAAASSRIAPVSLRVNPDVDAKTHPYISTGLRQNKFGVPFEQALPLYLEARSLPGIRIAGIDCHIGSQIVELEPFLNALQKVLELTDRLAAEGIELEHVDLGGGLGIRYQDEQPPAPDRYISAMLPALRGRHGRILLEPGRALVGNAGVLLTRVEYVKHGAERDFAVVDAAMNDLMRPALYDAWHEIRAVRKSPAAERRYEVVGPVCESADFLGHDRALAIEPGDLLAVLSAGAYGMSMSSNYNSRPRAAEVLVDGARVELIRSRETLQDLMHHERLPP